MAISDIIVIQDTREQKPWKFKAIKSVEIAKLYPGDYSVKGFEDKICIERKSKSDIIHTLCSKERARFIRELEAMESYEAKCVIIEANMDDMWVKPRYSSKVHPVSYINTICQYCAKYNIPFFFASDRTNARYLAEQFIIGYMKKIGEI